MRYEFRAKDSEMEDFGKIRLERSSGFPQEHFFNCYTGWFGTDWVSCSLSVELDVCLVRTHPHLPVYVRASDSVGRDSLPYD